MKKFLLIIFILLVLAGVFLLTPVIVFFSQLSSLDFQGEVLYEHLYSISALSISEQSGETEADSTWQTFTITVPEEDLDAMLAFGFKKHNNSVVKVRNVKSTISPETILISIYSQYGLFDHRIFYAHVISEWMFRDSSDGLIEVKPLDIHTDHLYSVNWANMWKYVSKTGRTDGWVVLPVFYDLQFQSLTLNEHEVTITIAQ